MHGTSDSNAVTRPRARTPRLLRAAGIARLALLVAAVAGCSMDEILQSDELPPDIANPAATRTAEGAVAAYHAAFGQFRRAFGARAAGNSVGTEPFVAIVGLLTDELRLQVASFDGIYRVDDRDVPELAGGVDASLASHTYSELQRARALAGQGTALLTRYAPDTLQFLAAHLYAIQGYTEVFLAELFCSGIPLSTIDFDGDYTLSPGIRTDDVYRHALALFDTAAALAGDSVQIAQLASVGRARALLGLGELAEAALAVADVPDGFRDEVNFTPIENAEAASFAMADGTGWPFSVSDVEGINGRPFRTGGDPRTATTNLGIDPVLGQSIHHPDKYSIDGSTAIVLADWIEARLIGAEAALAEGDDTWLTTLNALRTDGSYTTQPNPDDPAVTDTSWNAGTAGVAGLAPLDDPGTPEARLDLLFSERAAWLFLTGHRQGDLRRLVRHYGRSAESTYPTGFYWQGGRYGAYVELPIPPSESEYNPRFTGCLSRGA